MILKDEDYLFLIRKYKNAGIPGKKLEERLKMIDPYVSINILKITLSPLDF